jgi:carboxylesterase
MFKLPFTPFSAPEHRDFLLTGGAPAALLIHGYPGTPYEMRPLADALHAQGWTCRGVLLPGFGTQIESLPARKWTEWLDFTLDALDALRREHRPLLLIGHSMGAAVAICAAARAPVDGMVLLAPYWRNRGPLWAILPLLKRLLPHIRPFRLMKTEMDDPRLRAMIQSFLPELDLEDARVQQSVREFAVPLGMFDELRQLGLAAWRAAPQVRCRTWMLQGVRDDTVKLADTLRLARRFTDAGEVLELDAAHELPFENSPVLPQVRQAVLAYAGAVAATGG